MLPEYNISPVSVEFSKRQKFTSLGKSDLHIWQISLTNDEELLDLCTSVLDKETHRKAGWFKFKRNQNKYIICHGILRLLLADYLKLNTSEFSIAKHKKGKPFIAENPVFFNMSDSGDLCVYAFTRTGEVGIDIEEERELPDLDELIAKNLTNREMEFIEKFPNQRSTYFFRFWTMKEAYLKAIGEGMRLTPDKLEFSIEKTGIKLSGLSDIYQQDDWIIKEFFTKTSYFGTMVFKNIHTNIRHFVLK